MSEISNMFWVYENLKYPTILAFKNEQPEYMMTGYNKYKCVSIGADLDSYIYFIQHQADIVKKENAKLKRKLEKEMSLIKKAQNIERDRVREECGNPGFDGPMTIETWMDEMIEEIEGKRYP